MPYLRSSASKPPSPCRGEPTNRSLTLCQTALRELCKLLLLRDSQRAKDPVHQHEELQPGQDRAGHGRTEEQKVSFHLTNVPTGTMRDTSASSYLAEVVVVVSVVDRVVLGSHDWLEVRPLHSTMHPAPNWPAGAGVRASIYNSQQVRLGLTTASWMLVAQTPEKKSRTTWV